MSFLHTAHRVAEESMPLATACLCMCACLGVWLATGLSGWLDARLCVLSGWLDACLCVLSRWLDACLSVCQLTGNLLSPRIAKCFAHAHRPELHKSPSYIVQCHKQKQQSIKNGRGRGSRRTKKEEKSWCFHSQETNDAFPSFVVSCHNSKLLHRLLTKFTMSFGLSDFLNVKFYLASHCLGDLLMHAYFHLFSLFLYFLSLHRFLHTIQHNSG